MAGLSSQSPHPVDIVLHPRRGVLAVRFDDGAQFDIPVELMRVLSPSAEVQGHSPEQAVLQTGKRGVQITALEPVGHYALRPRFSDGHESGLYTWAYLYQLGRDQDALWNRYLAQLAEAGAQRDPPP